MWRSRGDGSGRVFEERIWGGDGVFCHFVGASEEGVCVPFVGGDLVISEEVEVLVTEGGRRGRQEVIDFREVDGGGVMTGGEDGVASEGCGIGVGGEEVGRGSIVREFIDEIILEDTLHGVRV